MLEVKNIYCGYNGKDVIKNITFKAERGKHIAIIGPNGCGKSTLLKAIDNLLDYRGNILLDGKEVKKFNRKNLAKKIALMSQNFEIYFPYTVYETVALGRYSYINGIFGELSKKDKEIIVNAIKKVGLMEYKDRLINELSGGQLQRVYLARVFAQEPEIILLDEPTNHLDLKYQIEILEEVTKWAHDNNKIVIGIIHDLNLVQFFSDEAILIKEGEIFAKGKTREVLQEDKLREVYGINIKEWMKKVLEKWK